MKDILESINLSKHLDTFVKENVTLTMLLSMSEADLYDMFEAIGINTFGDRFLIKRAVLSKK